jgi:sugar lactone lactonase YvrE
MRDPGAIIVLVASSITWAPATGKASDPAAGSPGRAGIPIHFRLDRECFVTLVDDDVEGNRVRNLIAETRLPGGESAVWWDGYDDGEWDQRHNLVRHRVPPGTYRVRGLVHDGIRMRYEFPVYSPGTPPWKTRDGSGGWLADHSPPADVLFLPEGGPPHVRGASRLLVCSTSGEAGEEFVWLNEDGRRLYGTNDGFWGGTHLSHDSGPKAVAEHDAYVFISGERDLDNDVMEVRAFKKDGRIESVVKITFPHESVRRFKTNSDGYGADGLAVHDGLVVIAFTHMNKLIFADARRRSVVGEVAIPSPRGLSFDRQGRLYVITEAKVKRFSLAPGQARLADEATVIADGLSEPRRTFVADDGTLYIADWGASHQVKAFSPDGKLLRTIGRPGGPQLGRYDERRMSYPCGMAIDRRGRLWVAEAETYPKRLSQWRADDGSFVRAWYGPPKYGGGGAIDPHDKRRFFYAEYDRGGGIAFDLNWEKGESKVRSIFWRPERFEEAVPGPAPERAHSVAGRTFLTNCYNGQLRYNQDRGATIWRLDPDDIARPVAVLGNAADLNHSQWGWAMRHRDAINALWKGKDPALIFLAWCDDNDDHVAEPEEVRWPETTRMNGHGEALREVGLMPLIDPDLSVTTSHGTRLAPPTISARGIPIYDLSRTTVVGLADMQRSPLVGRDHALTYRDGTDVLFGSDLGGRRRWRMNWVEGDPPSSDRLVQATRPNGPPVRPGVGEAGDLVAYSGEKGAIFLLTLDGLFVQTLGGDERTLPTWRMPEKRRGMTIEGVTFGAEQFHPTITQVDGGEIYMVVGHEHSSIVRLEGFETVRRLDVGPLVVDEGSLRDLPETLVERAREQGRDTLAVIIRDGAPEVDGRLHDWPPETNWVDLGGQAKAAVTVAGDRLYAAFHTGDRNALANGGTDHRYLFNTGGALDLMLGADLGADRNRREPARGDVRLLVASIGGRTKAVLFRAVAPDAPEGRDVLYQSPIGRVHFDEVADISDSVALAGHDGDFEFSVPLTVLGLRPEKEAEALGDLGILRGDGAQTTRRIYWNNLDTGLVSDIPSEARLRPTNWGVWRFR